MIKKILLWLTIPGALVAAAVAAWLIINAIIDRSSLASTVNDQGMTLAQVADAVAALRFNRLIEIMQTRRLSPKEHIEFCTLAMVFKMGELARAEGC